ncbi:uncharacterized protein FIBRA_00703 [Fibroporia radiculosa]|uniref:gluconokinase n=1 Tax=Fibroporia radiculosa TaxID=599839 RepID=J4H0I3_9APHY|nr:uncharacterized protein FIBRA_00703 [Fibroporia radiculosa]CCL98699.1 predicted protein [Fibroporia radiculosa]
MPDGESEHPAPVPILIVVMGVAGTGKTTLASALGETLRLPYIEGDELHPPANIAKMAAGTPLTDADREPWLALLRTTAEHLVAVQQAGTHTDADADVRERPAGIHYPAEAEAPERAPGRRTAGVLMTCSALRKGYRDILRGVVRPSLPAPVHELAPPAREALPTYFVYIKGEREMLLDRVAKRQGHYMKANMVDSQLATLESPEGEDGIIVVGMDASTEAQRAEVLQRLAGVL